MTLTAFTQAMSLGIEFRHMTEKTIGGATLLEALFVALVTALRASITPTASIPDGRALAHDHHPVLVTTPL